MKLVLDPSLEHFALIKIVTGMWNQADVWCLLSEFDYFTRWQQIEKRVMDKVPHLPLPELVREKIKCFITFIGIQILEWMKYHNRGHRRIVIPAEFCWTCHGTIDRKKTAEMLMKDERIGVIDRYQLACVYCLESDIPVLWNKISEVDVESFRYRVPYQDEFLSFWERKMRYGEPCSPQHIFEVSAVSGNKAATEYFFGKLTTAEKQECLLEAAKSVDDAETLCFLLMQMDEADQREVFHEDPLDKLESFLNWPFQSLFGEVVKYGLEFISCAEFYDLLTKVLDKIEEGYKDWDYRDIFRILWQEGKPCCKDYIRHEWNEFLLEDLLRIKDEQIIKLIIQDASVEDKRRLINSAPVLRACERLFLEKDWDLLGFVIRSLSSGEGKVEV